MTPMSGLLPVQGRVIEQASGILCPRTNYSVRTNQPYARTNAYFNSFVPHTISTWNSLHQLHVTAPSVSALIIIIRLCLFIYSTHILIYIVIGAHSISSCYCVSFAQHKCFIDKKKKKKRQTRQDHTWSIFHV